VDQKLNIENLMEKYIFLIFLISKICFASLNHYLKMPKTDVVSHDLAYFECGEGIYIYIYK
jgi:hypothetical protein